MLNSNYAFKRTAEQALRSNQTIVPQPLNAALGPMGDVRHSGVRRRDVVLSQDGSNERGEVVGGESETQAERKSQFSPLLALGIEVVLLILAVGVFGFVYTNGLQAAAIVVAVILAVLVMWMFSGRKKSATGSWK